MLAIDGKCSCKLKTSCVWTVYECAATLRNVMYYKFTRPENARTFSLRENTLIQKTSNFELLIACGLFSFILALNHSRSQKVFKKFPFFSLFRFPWCERYLTVPAQTIERIEGDSTCAIRDFPQQHTCAHASFTLNKIIRHYTNNKVDCGFDHVVSYNNLCWIIGALFCLHQSLFALIFWLNSFRHNCARVRA